jgi:hypothetical protein
MTDIRGCRERIALEWHDVGEMALTDKERAGLRLHRTLLIDDLVTLMKRLNEADDIGRS